MSLLSENNLVAAQQVAGADEERFSVTLTSFCCIMALTVTIWVAAPSRRSAWRAHRTPAWP